MSILGLGGPGLGLPYPPNNLGFAPQGGSNYIEMAAGAVHTIPAGQAFVRTGPYTSIQFLDPVSGLWRPYSSVNGASAVYVNSDGQNYRVANLTGCALGAIMTNLGTGYTSTPIVTSSTGSSLWTAIVGGSIGAITVGTAGSGYTNAPKVYFSAPPVGGVQATGVAVLSGGTVASITLIDAGAGYTAAPTITIAPSTIDPGVAAGTIVTAKATCVLNATNAAKVTAILNTNPGTPITSVPVLTVSGGGGSGATATAVMCFTTTALTVSGGGGYTAPVGWQSIGGAVTATDVIGNPGIGASLLQVRPGFGAITLSGAALSTASVIDGGLFTAVPAAGISTNVTYTTLGTVGTPAVGGVNDYVIIQGI